MLHEGDPRDNYNRVSVEILFTDLSLALTFTEIAQAHLGREWVARTVLSARKAYEAVLKGRSTFSMTEAELGELEAQLELLRNRLKELGQTFD